MKSVRSNSLSMKYQKFTPSDCKDIEIRKFEFVAKTQLLSLKHKLVVIVQGTYGRKVISEVYAFFVLQCTVFGRKSKHKTDVTA